MESKGAPTGLSQGQEFRFEVAEGETVSIKLLGGMAELFGAEMAPARQYQFVGPTHEAIFTWHGCSLQVEGACRHSYVASETPMQSYMHLHADLEQQRAAARQRDGDGPRVLVAGGHGCGKASLCRMLANWASRAGGAPVLVELGLSHGRVGLPGAVAATSVGWPLDIERGTDDAAPLAYWTGHASAEDDPALYKQRVAKLAEGVARRLKAHPVTTMLCIYYICPQWKIPWGPFAAPQRRDSERWAGGTLDIHCKTASLATWLVSPFGLVRILLGQ